VAYARNVGIIKTARIKIIMKKNKVFQWIWNFIFKPLIPAIGSDKIQKQYWRMLWQIRIAKLFGLKRVFIGDSNSAGFAKYSIMKQSKKTTVCLGVGGTLTTDWIRFFKTRNGFRIYLMIHQLEVIWNIAGNHMLLNEMPSARMGLKILHQSFSASYNCTITPLNDAILSEFSKLVPGLYKPAEQYHRENLELNNYIRDEWKDCTIDLYEWFLSNNSNGAYFLALRDVVHLSDMAMEYILFVLDEIGL